MLGRRAERAKGRQAQRPGASSATRRALPRRTAPRGQRGRAMALPQTSPPVDPQSAPTHIRGWHFVALLLGVWPLAVALGLGAAAFGLPAAVTIASALAVALALDFVIIVVTLEVDDGDVQHDVEGNA